MSDLRLALLGSPTVTMAEESVVLESRKTLALLYYLAATQQRHSRDALAAILWPEQDQARARASLRQSLWMLRNAGLEPWLVVDQDALMLQAGYWCDVHLFRAEVAAGNLTQALALYRGDFLTGFSLRDCPEFDQWQFLLADELRRQLATLLEAGVQRCVEQGDYASAIDYARRWLALDALHEPIHRHLMLLYAYAGQQAAALRQYEECVRLLEEELGVSPEDETTTLYHAIKARQISPPKASALTPSTIQANNLVEPSAAAAPFHNLPTQLTPFVGRESELQELVQILADPECRLVTILGPGGIGKTRLAVQVARHFSPEQTAALVFPQGVMFVALNAVESTSGIVTAIAEAGGFVFYSNQAPRQQLLDYLRDKQMLLLLDNFEHLLAGAELIADILAHASKIKVLVTSRETLNLQGEWQWMVSGLPVPEEAMAAEKLLDSSAVRLFVQSARRVQPNFSITDDAEHVARICRLVGGMPLAIELAAAWLRVVPCAQIAREIERDLNFLTTRLRDVPDRHRSIQAVFEHSWRLLSPSEQSTFQQLSIFRGGFDRKSAEQVTGASMFDLATLVEKSLLSVNTSGRYYIHELLRQYGAAKLDGDPVARQTALERHCVYFAEFLAARQAAINGEGLLQATAEITIELDNVRAAWQWALQQRRLDDIIRSATTFYMFFQSKSRFLEGAHALRDAHECLQSLEASYVRDLALAGILNYWGWLCIRLGEFDQAAAHLQQSQRLYAQLNAPPQRVMGGDPTVPLAIIHQIQGNYQRAIEVAEVARQVAAEHDDHHNLAFAHYALAASHLALGRYEVAGEHARRACALAQAAGTRWFLAYTLNESGKVARAVGNLAEAEAHFQASYAIKVEFGDAEGMAVALNHLGEITYLQKHYPEAEQLYGQSRDIYANINDRGGLANSYKGLGQVACALGDLDAAKSNFAQALTIATQIHFLPLTCAILLDVSKLLMRIGLPAFAIEVLAVVRNHPASDYETKERATERIVQWQSEMAGEQFAQALERGTDGALDAIVQQVAAVLSVAPA